MIGAKVKDDDLRELSRLPQKLRKEFSSALLRIAQAGVKAARSRAPRRSGATASSLDAWVEGEKAYIGQRGGGPVHSFFQEVGYRWHFAPGINAWVGKKVNPGGYFLRPGAEEAASSAEATRYLEGMVDKL